MAVNQNQVNTSIDIPHRSFCILPWISVSIDAVGTVRPCCMAEDTIKDPNGKDYHINEASIELIRSSEQMNNMRQQFLNKEKPKACRSCWETERAGNKSKRQFTLERFSNFVDESNWQVESKPMSFLDVKLGNICNLKCRICSPWSSSALATEELPEENKKESFPYKMIEQGRWPRVADDFWTELNGNINNIRYLEFTGGEPFMIKEHFDFLQTLVDKGVAKNIEIHYNTNGTQYPEKNLAVWKEFKLVEIMFSIDDVGPRFEYQRKNASWSEVNDNIIKFKELANKFKNIKLQSMLTISVYNIMYLEEIISWTEKQNFNTLIFNIVYHHEEDSIRSLPVSIKEQIKEELMNIKVSNQYKSQIQNLINFMFNHKSLNDCTKLINKIKNKDKIRNEYLCDHHSKLAEAIGYDKESSI